ncbi:tripartite tricarboxylate transporter permease [Marinobacter sp. X15-166B]|uniref:tripartite tricarboxylate transporter permease n=1 Tax=Marinobacter sp. X15-166B TaxID=1897620 RepID=UPI00085C7F06|nr:tripartite tricarboxylate transporter permease [Marinobacter sp. X15-166B]OEY66108.1 hypothetical protein BG841_06310 [Marinobacter sp. X15-166B]
MEILASFDFVASFFAIALGLFVGMLLGALPGLGMIIGITLLLPLSYSMDPASSILMLLAVYQGAEYGGSISAIVLKIPGTAMAAPIMFDGVPMAENKSPGKALAYSLYGSTFGGLFGGAVLIFFSEPVARFALKLADPEIFWLSGLGLFAVVTLGGGNVSKTAISVILGLFVGTMGIDLFSGIPRFTMDSPSLLEGPNLIAVVVGLFAISEVLNMNTKNMNLSFKFEKKDMKTSLTFREMLQTVKAMFAGSFIGSVIGVLPGVGSVISSWLAYSGVKKLSRQPETFGKGNPEGIAGPDASNNATVGGALLPFLALGIPGSASIAIIAGAFIIHGITPGPQMIRNNPELINALYIGFIFTTIGMFFMGRFMTTLFAKALVTPNALLAPAIVASSLMGVYSSSGNFFDIWLMLGLGVVAFFLRKLDYSVAGFILALVLSPIIEKSFRRALVITDGDFSAFYSRPYSQVLLVIIAGMILYMFYGQIRNLMKARARKNSDKLAANH